MIIATRTLTLRDKDHTVDMPIRFHAPEQIGREWRCRFEIGWPDAPVERWGTGEDGVQAIVQALQMVGAELYTSRHHEAGALTWLSPGAGYGVPVPQGLRDLMVGDDAKFL